MLLPYTKSSSFKLKDSFKKIILQLKDPFLNASIERPVQKNHPSIEGRLSKNSSLN
jgi:hypothetical protein